MTVKPKLDARGKVAAAEAAVERWRAAVAKAETEMTMAAGAGDAGRVASILDRLDRLRDRMSAAEARLVHAREGLPKALKREKAAQSAIRAGMKLAGQVAAAAPRPPASEVESASPADAPRRRRQKAPPLAGPVQRGRKEVPDPWEPGARITVPCNTRESPIEHMASRKRIDAAQKAAADRYRALYERAQLGPLRAIDPAKEHVDGGRLGDPLNDGVMEAARELARTNASLGHVAAALLINIVGEGLGIDVVARRYPRLTEKRAHGYVTGRLMEALDQLVEQWGLIAEGTGRKRITGSGPISVTGPQVEQDFVRPARAVDRLMHVPGAAKVAIDRGP